MAESNRRDGDNDRTKKRRRAPFPYHLCMLRSNYDLSDVKPMPPSRAMTMLFDNVKYLKHRVDESANSYSYSCIILANTDDIIGEQRCANYLGALTNFIPSLWESAKETLRIMGSGVIEIHEGNQGVSEVPISGPIEADRLAAMIGQMILIMYNDVKEHSYERDMKTISADLCKAAGFHGSLVEGDDNGILLSFKNAQTINRMLRVRQTIRTNVLNRVLSFAAAKPRDSLVNVMRYVKKALEWAEMSTLKLIHDTLLATYSPVVNYGGINHEMFNLENAILEINKTEHPQYFRIFHPQLASHVLTMSLFPVLAAVARRVKMMDQGSSSNYVGSANNDSEFVNRMVNVHLEYIEKKKKEEEKKKKTEYVDRLVNVHLEYMEKKKKTEFVNRMINVHLEYMEKKRNEFVNWMVNVHLEYIEEEKKKNQAQKSVE